MTSDPIHDYNIWLTEQERKMARLPVCDRCGNRITGEHKYRIMGAVWCEDCVEECKEYNEEV